MTPSTPARRSTGAQLAVMLLFGLLASLLVTAGLVAAIATYGGVTFSEMLHAPGARPVPGVQMAERATRPAGPASAANAPAPIPTASISSASAPTTSITLAGALPSPAAPLPGRLTATQVSPAAAITAAVTPLPAVAGPGAAAPRVIASGLTAPGFTAPGFTAPGFTAPGFTAPGATGDASAAPAVSTALPTLFTPGRSAAGPKPSAGPTAAAAPAALAAAQPAMPTVQTPTTEVSRSMPIAWVRQTAARRAPDGQYYFDTALNGATIRMMFDTGASSVALRAEDAARAGIDLSTLNYNVTAHTANGTTTAALVRLDSLQVGGITRRNVQAIVSRPGQLSVSLLGQSFMSKLAGYRFEKEELVLQGE